MTIQLGVATRNARLDALEVAIGASAVLTIRTGAQPANCAAGSTGTALATILLPADWLAAASGGSKGIANGPWSDASADATGTAAHFRIHSGGGVCEMQGSCGMAGASPDLVIDNSALVAGQSVSITSFTLNDNNS